MNMNSRIVILGQPIDVRLVETTDPVLSSMVGRCFISKNLIVIDGSIAEGQIKSTLLHEIIEYIQISLRLRLEERQICGLEVGLYEVLTRHPDLLSADY